MCDFSNLLWKTEEYVREYMKQFEDSSHDWHHVDRVRRTALTLAREEIQLGRTIDIQLVELSALLHDVGDFKFLKDGQTSESILQEFMVSAGYTEELAKAIEWVHGRISFRHELAHPDSSSGPYVSELACVQDADRLEAIGAIGIARCFAYNGARNLPLYDPKVEPMIDLTAEKYNKQLEKGKSNARNHFYEKLLKLSGMMKTVGGRREAEVRHQVLKFFITAFDRECGLDPSCSSHFN